MCMVYLSNVFNMYDNFLYVIRRTAWDICIFWPSYSTSVQVLTSAMAEVAKNFVPVTSAPQRPPLASDTPESSVPPEKIANLRASYLQQLRDLYGLYDCGALT